MLICCKLLAFVKSNKKWIKNINSCFKLLALKRAIGVLSGLYSTVESFLQLVNVLPKPLQLLLMNIYESLSQLPLNRRRRGVNIITFQSLRYLCLSSNRDSHFLLKWSNQFNIFWCLSYSSGRSHGRFNYLIWYCVCAMSWWKTGLVYIATVTHSLREVLLWEKKGFKLEYE